MIYDVARQIPRGRVTTYGAIAKLLDPANARMVGYAIRACDDKGDKIVDFAKLFWDPAMEL